MSERLGDLASIELSLRSAWMDRGLDTTYANVDRLALWGYPFPKDEQGRDAQRSCKGRSMHELARKGINVVAVHPGATRTERTDPASEKTLAANISIGRIVDASEVRLGGAS